MALGPKEMGAAIIRNLKEKTGQTIEEWLETVRASGLTEKKELISFLKKEKGLGHFQATRIYEEFKGIDQYKDAETLPDKIFDSKILKKRYEFAKAKIMELGPGIKVQPCRTYIPFYRNKQFAILTTVKGTVVLGLNLPENFTSERFINNTSIGTDRINFQTTILNEVDWDDEVIKAIQTAYKKN